MSDNTTEVNSMNDLEEIVEDNADILVDFYADWCGPCKMMEPTIEEIAEEYDVKVVEVDIDANQQIATEFGVRSVPTYVFYKDQEIVDNKIGYQEKEVMTENLSKIEN